MKKGHIKRLDKICFVCRFKKKATKVISGKHWWLHVKNKHDYIMPPHAVVKNCKFYDDVLLEYCIDVTPEEQRIPVEECSVEVLPEKRNAPDDLSNIQLPQLRALENEFVQNDAPDSEPKFRKKHKPMESEENSAMKEVNALPVDENENFTD